MLKISDCVLVVTDIQGKLAESMHEKEILYKNAGIMIEGAKILGIPLLWAEQYPEGLGRTVPEIAKHLEGYAPHPKRTFSSLADEGFRKAFLDTGRKQALLTGIETHVCIYQTSLDLIESGIETHIVADAVSSRTASNKKTGLDSIARASGHITSTEMALFELLRTSEHADFKQIINLVK